MDAMSDQQIPLPPATFEFLVISLKTQTEYHLGLLHFGEEKDRPEPDFRIARHNVDLLAMLQEKTRGNCTQEEQRLIDNALTELRFRFVQAMEQHHKKAAESAAASTAPETAPENDTAQAPAEEQASE
jgi:hypothetical protein